MEGEVAHDALPAIYRQSDAFLLGSWHEAQCMAVLEAMACGLPWVGPPVGVLQDIAAFGTDTPSGLLFPGRNPRSVADRMIRVALLDAGERVEWGRRARVVVLEHYALAQQSARLLSLLKGLTERD
jgi:type III pantothenate kinase